MTSATKEFSLSNGVTEEQSAFGSLDHAVGWNNTFILQCRNDVEVARLTIRLVLSLKHSIAAPVARCSKGRSTSPQHKPP